MENKVELGVVDQNTEEIAEEQRQAEEYFARICFIVGQSTLDYAIHSSREEFFQHMEELYNAYHKDEPKSKIIVPKKEIIVK